MSPAIYATAARWGQFGTTRDGGCGVHCGICGLSFTLQSEKAAHLKFQHGAQVRRVSRVAGIELYEWTRP